MVSLLDGHVLMLLIQVAIKLYALGLIAEDAILRGNLFLCRSSVHLYLIATSVSIIVRQIRLSHEVVEKLFVRPPLLRVGRSTTNISIISEYRCMSLVSVHICSIPRVVRTIGSHSCDRAA